MFNSINRMYPRFMEGVRKLIRRKYEMREYMRNEERYMDGDVINKLNKIIAKFLSKNKINYYRVYIREKYSRRLII